MTGIDLLSTYHLLGRSGLRVSPLGLGAMTFGSGPWQADESVARAMFNRYLEAGGNFVDTANVYGMGESETLVGRFIAEQRCRDRVVLATKFSGGLSPGNANAVGNGRKNIVTSLEASLRRLGTDYVDVYWLHAWDRVTPVEEVMSTLDALVRSGKVLAVGLSDIPVWYAVKAQMSAAANGWEPVAAMQLEYSLVERTIEWEYVPLAFDLGMAVVPWSPLAGGFLSGKYRRRDGDAVGEGRVAMLKGTPFENRIPDRHWAVLDEVGRIAEELGCTPAHVALAWVLRRPGVVSTLVGARTIEQFDDNLAAAAVDLSVEQRARLEAASAPEPPFPHRLYASGRAATFGWDVQREPPWFRGSKT